MFMNYGITSVEWRLIGDIEDTDLSCIHVLFSDLDHSDTSLDRLNASVSTIRCTLFTLNPHLLKRLQVILNGSCKILHAEKKTTDLSGGQKIPSSNEI